MSMSRLIEWRSIRPGVCLDSVHFDTILSFTTLRVARNYEYVLVGVICQTRFPSYRGWRCFVTLGQIIIIQVWPHIKRLRRFIFLVVIKKIPRRFIILLKPIQFSSDLDCEIVIKVRSIATIFCHCYFRISIVCKDGLTKYAAMLLDEVTSCHNTYLVLYTTDYNIVTKLVSQLECKLF